MPHCLTLSNLKYVSWVKWSNPGKGVPPSLTPRCSSYWKGNLLVALDYGRQLYLYVYMWTQVCTIYIFFFVHCNRGGPSDQPDEWGKHLWVCRWDQSVCDKVLGSENKEWWRQWMMWPFLNVLRSSVAAFLLVSLSFVPCLTTSRHLSLFCARYSRQLEAIPKDFMETSSILFLASCAKIVRRRAVADNMTGPTKLWMHQDCVDAGKRSSN